MPWRKQRFATFHDKEIFKVLPLDGTPTKGIVIDSTTVPVGADGRYVLEAGTIMCKAHAGQVSQQNTITNTATGGTGTVTVNGQTTPALPFNVTQDDLQGALEALTSVGHGDVTVTKVGQVYTLVFGGALANVAVTVSVGVGSLTGGTWTLATSVTAAAGTSSGTLARPALSTGEVAGDILGILTHTLEFFYPVEAGITDEPASVYYAFGHFDVTKLVNYSGNSAAFATACPMIIVS